MRILVLSNLAEHWQLVRLLGAQSWRGTSPTIRTGLIILVGGLLILALDSFILQPYVYSLRRLGIPKLSPSNGKHALDHKPMLDEAAIKYPDRPWLFSYSGFEFVVFPSAYVDEIRRLPARTASLVDFLTTVQFGSWHLIGLNDSSNTLHKTASTDLARSVGLMCLERQQAAHRACISAIGPCPEWKTLPLCWTLLDIVVATSATGLVGEPLSRDSRWLKAVQRLPLGVGVGLYVSCFFPRLLRPLIATIFYSPAWLLYRWMALLLRPTVEQAVRRFQQIKGDKKGASEKQQKGQEGTTLVDLLMTRYKPEEFQTDQLIRYIVTATFESAPTTGVSIYWMLIEIILRPDLVDELREELATALKDGKLPPTQLAELPKIDSLMRESARVNTFHYLGLSRILREPVQFSIGPKLPKGTIICVDQDNIHNSSTIYKDPHIFDPKRFYRMRQQAGHETRNTTPVHQQWTRLTNLGRRASEPRTGKPQRLSFPNGSAQPDMNFKFMIRERRL
ncbi:cytochrome P450 [Leptodontidium sp. MPI-SDFR-AT-0119]|nr:cytochrome P450 [Leptodontidium sp. MPI-SDFR-AT-0119]